MTESFRRSGEYETPQGHEPQSAYPQQQYASAPQSSSPVNPEWPPPPAYEPPTVQQPAYQEPAQIQPQAPQAPYGRQATHEQPADTATATATLLAEPPADPAAPAPRKKRGKGPFALLAAVAIVAAAIGGGTAYGIQELTNSDSAVTSSSTSTNVVPSSAKGTVSGVAAAVSPSIVEINATSNAGSSTGSGVIITSDGEIITNNHVITGASSVKVSTSDGKTYTAKVVGTDSKKDLALIKLENASGLKTATLGDSAGVQVGDEVVAIGSPEGLTGTVTSGIVSALNRDVTVATEESQGQGQQQQQGGGSGSWPFEFGGQQFNGDTGTSTTTYKALQTDASLNPGNSGGALIDMNGNIIGINSAMYSAASSSSDAGSAGLGFAIPINTVKSDLATLRSGSTS
ncbi:trypsin-like peptidase domain-containing protein [Streptomyces sp. SID12488]|uniref:S1C family serine protease n=1 Tax=Streptomyces sp. SID12488 TaxID=2706040 RepID=UPI0013DA70E9|nr:trypsin-like peptidase domain-containing protein [Streptomyces sp. SID12488]NEA68013.1 trypsin-like serine protease [Streptomyces sp. SID12488]